MCVQQGRELASVDGCRDGKVHPIGSLLQDELQERTTLPLLLDKTPEFFSGITRVPQPKRAPVLLMTQQRPAGKSADLGKASLQVLLPQRARHGRRFFRRLKGHRVPRLELCDA